MSSSILKTFKENIRDSGFGHPDVDAEERLLFLPGVGDETCDEVLEKDIRARLQYRSFRRMNGVCWMLTFLNLILLGTVATLAGQRLRPWSVAEFNSCVKETSSYSPVFDSSRIEHHEVKLNGTLWPGETPSWSRKEPGDSESEARWESFEFMPTFPITRQDIISLGKDPDTSARFPDNLFGLGEEAYIASLDVRHKIHCLNELRKMTFTDYGEDKPTKKGHGRLWWVHLRHCVDMLVQDMICHADADLITYRWMDTQPNPFPDFSLNRRCRTLDAIFEYEEKHQVNMTTYGKLSKPDGAVTVPAEPGYYVAYGFHFSELYPGGQGYDGPLPSQDDWFGYPPRPDRRRGN